MQDTWGKPNHGGNIWAAAVEWGIAPEKFLDYSANINPLGPAPESMAAIQASLGLLTHYPEPTGVALKTKLGKYLGVDPDNLVLGNGGSELIYLMGRMYGRRRVMRLAPTFSEYGEGIENCAICAINLDPQQQFRLPTREIINAMRAGDLIFIGNPNNPTGNIFPRTELERIVIQAGQVGAEVVIDEAFIDFVGDQSQSLRDLAALNQHLFIVGSLTKFFAIPALRLGYAVAAQENILRMEYLLPTWRINTFAQAAALAALDNQTYIRQTVALIQQERLFLSAGLAGIDGLVVYPARANFILIDGQGTGITAEQLQEKLGPEGVLIRKCNNFHNLTPYYFRLAVKNHADNNRLLEILRKVLVPS